MVREVEEVMEISPDERLNHIAVVPLPQIRAIWLADSKATNLARDAQVWQVNIANSSSMQVSSEIALAEVGLIHAYRGVTDVSQSDHA